jgi:hypothetical protein
MNGLVVTPNALTAGMTGLIVALSPACTEDKAMTVASYEARADVHYCTANVNTPIKVPERTLVGDPLVDFYQPRTELGRKLIELRRAYILGGGKLLSWDEVSEEVRERRGGVSDA